MPMLNIAFPSNALYFFNEINDISNFKIVSTLDFEENIFNFTATAAFE